MREAALTSRACDGAAVEIERIQRESLARGGDLVFTPNMISVLGAIVVGEVPLVTLADEEMAIVRRTDWKAFAPADLLRRRVNVQTRLRDLPSPQRMLPTRLGNVLRHYEDLTGQGTVEHLVIDVFDMLPPSLQLAHDEQRTRLDLYCSMVVVVAVVTALGTARVADESWYAVGIVAIGLIAMWLVYRAAVATARAYGPLLVKIATYADH